MRILPLILSLNFLVTDAQNLPDNYYFSDDNKMLLRGVSALNNNLYSMSTIDTIFLYFSQIDFWEQMLDNY